MGGAFVGSLCHSGPCSKGEYLDEQMVDFIFECRALITDQLNKLAWDAFLPIRPTPAVDYLGQDGLGKLGT